MSLLLSKDKHMKVLLDLTLLEQIEQDTLLL